MSHRAVNIVITPPQEFGFSVLATLSERILQLLLLCIISIQFVVCQSIGPITVLYLQGRLGNNEYSFFSFI